MSSGFNAGLDSSDVIVSYGVETTYATDPGVAFQRVRMLSEGFTVQKSRTRPAEIKADGQAAQALTTQEEASGSLSVGISVDTYDDLLAGLINAGDKTDFSAAASESQVDIDITTGGVITTTAGNFSVFKVGRYVKISGFVNAVNNGVFRVIAAATGTMTVAGPGDHAFVAETDQTVTIREGGSIRNGTTVATYEIQKQFAASIFFYYPGCYISGGSLNAALGGFFEGSFTFLAKTEVKSTATRSTGAELDAPTGRIIDTVTGIKHAGINDDAFDNSGTFDTILQSISLDITKESARSQYGIGSSAARGIGRGTLVVSGTVSVYFRNYQMYDLFVAETGQAFQFVALDDQGEGYVLAMPNVTLMNPTIVAGGPDTDLVAEFQLEGNPGIWDAVESPVASEFTIQIDRVQNA